MALLAHMDRATPLGPRVRGDDGMWHAAANCQTKKVVLGIHSQVARAFELIRNSRSAVLQLRHDDARGGGPPRGTQDNGEAS